MVLLKDLCEKGSSSIAQKDLVDREGEYPIYGASGFIKNIDFYQQEKPYIAVVKDGAGVGRVMLLPGKSSVIGTMQYIIPNKGVNAAYLAYAMEHMNLSKYYTGATIPHIYYKDYCVEQLPAHSLAEQENIVRHLATLEKLIALRNVQLAKLDELVKARFVEMFGDPISNPMDWNIDCAENHIDLLSGFPFDSSEYTEYGVNICGGLIILPQRIVWDECKHWKSTEGYEQYTLCKNDIVMALDRPWISEGFKIAMVDEEHLPALLIQRTARIRAIDMNQLYLMHCFLLGGFEQHCNVTGSLVPHISAKDIRSFKLMLPPLELQTQFATFVEQTNKTKLTIQASLDKLVVMKKALMQEYFG